MTGPVERLNAVLRRVPRGLAYAVGLLPAVWISWALFSGQLGADPVQAAEHRLGLTALQFLIATLAVTPLMRATGVKLIRLRRPLGLLAFTYAALHVLVWLALDLQFHWRQVAEDLLTRPHIVFGAVAMLTILPLALTSRDSSIRRLGAARWRRLHRLAYLAGVAAALHFLLLVKTLTLEPLLYAGAVAGLLAVRAIPRSGAAASRGLP
jgi:methionine sulfoxide reductase heme-binding subunit